MSEGTRDVRAAGILLPIFSLPGPHEIGDLGDGARRFLEFLAQGRQRLWQLLPVGVTAQEMGNSPYSSLSAFAIDPLLISLEDLVSDGLLDASDLPVARSDGGRIDYRLARAEKSPRLERAVSTLLRGRAHGSQELDAFRQAHAAWLGDHALFMALRDVTGTAAWTTWPAPLRDRESRALVEARSRHRVEVEHHEVLQLLAHRQWSRLREGAQALDIELVGDMPLYVAHESADVWAHPELFELDVDGLPSTVAGVPPDYFSDTGQLWANPVYRWAAHKGDGYAWWRARVDHALRLFDRVRLDHFRGIAAYWAVPAAAAVALDGLWIAGPGRRLLGALAEGYEKLPVVAEDLGVIDPTVDALRRAFGLPGMRVLQFGFDSDMATSVHAPENIAPDTMVFTGTHDNNTTRGWFEDEIDRATKRRLERLVGHRVRPRAVADVMIQLGYASAAADVVVPLQDVAGLASPARMNTPGQAEGNWLWRAGPGMLSPKAAERLAAWVETHDRGGDATS